MNATASIRLACPAEVCPCNPPPHRPARASSPRTIADHLDDPHAGRPGAEAHDSLLGQLRVRQPQHVHRAVQARHGGGGGALDVILRWGT